MVYNQNQDEQEKTQSFSPELIKQAKDMGWVDRSEWRGDPDTWRGPDEYVRRGKEVIPIMRAQMARQEAETSKKEAEFTARQNELREQIRRQEEASRRFEEQLVAQKKEFEERTTRNDHIARLAIERQRQTFLEQIDAAKRLAVQSGDAERYDGLVARETQFYKQAQQEDESYARKPVERNDTQYTQAQTQQTQNYPVMPERDLRIRDGWIEDNSWFTRSPELNVEAQQIHMEMWRLYPGLDLKDNLERVSQEIKRRHPEKFGLEATTNNSGQGQNEGSYRQDNTQNYGQQSQDNTQNYQNNSNRSNSRQENSQPRYSSVEGGTGGLASGGVSSRQRGWDDIHPDDRALAEKSYIRTGFYGADQNKAREAYARDYWEDYS